MTTGPEDTGYEPRQRNAPRALLRQIRDIMAAETKPQARLDRLVRTIAANLVVDVCSIYVRRADDSLELFATVGLRESAIHRTRLQLNEGLVGWVARHRQPLKTADAPAHEAFSYRAEVGEENLKTFLGVPIVRAGQSIGVLVVQSIARREFFDDDVEVAQTVATILAEIVSSGAVLEEQALDDVAQVLARAIDMRGAGVVEGIAIGVVAKRDPNITVRQTFSVDVSAELQRLKDALATVRKSVDDMLAASAAARGVTREVLEVFRLFAYDRGWARRLEERVLSGLVAEVAVEQVRDENRQRMRSVGDPYLQERLHDLEDLSRRLLRVLIGAASVAEEIPDRAIFVTDTLGPAELLDLPRGRLAGLVVASAATTSHAAIIARGLGIPMVAGIAEIVEKAAHGDTILIDGSTGDVHLRPLPEVHATFTEKVRLRSVTRAHFASLRDLPAVTQDGVRIDLQMNAGLIEDLAHLDESGASAIGLFRTELQFLLGRSLPSAAAQRAFYTRVLDLAGDRPVVFRTTDLGSDKQAGYMHGPREANPAMGWRGLRMAIDRSGLIRTQIRALLAAGADRKLAMMLPLVSTRRELLAAQAIIDKEVTRVRRLGRAAPAEFRVGAMIEIPSAAWRVADIAAACDFVTIGGNDLAQFFFAADRDNSRVSERYDAMFVSFLSFLGRTISEAKSVGKPIGFCGEQAADPLMAMALIGLGIERLSVAASAIGPLKAMVRGINRGVLAAEVERLLAMGRGSLREPLRAFAELHRIPVMR